MLNYAASFSSISQAIARDPQSWRGISLVYLKLYGEDGDAILAECLTKNAEALVCRPDNGEIMLLGDELHCHEAEQKTHTAFKTVDIARDWQAVCALLSSLEASLQDEGVPQALEQARSLLIVEDEPVTSQIMTQQLKKFGTVIATSNAREAVANYMVHRPDMVFLDIHYAAEDTDGFDVLAHLLSADSHAFVVMVSGDWSAPLVMRALAAGAQGFVAKPFRKEDFAHYLTKHHRLKRPAAA